MKTTLIIQGMHCKSCEILLEDKINANKDVKVISISHKTGKLTLELKNNTDLESVKTLINKQGYQIQEDSPKKEKNTKHLWIILITGILILLYLFNSRHIMPNFEEINLGVALILGIIASASTCLAVTGGIIMGYSEHIETKHPWKTQIQFHIGRIVAFFIWGIILGFVGKSIGTNLIINIILNIIIGSIIFYIGLQSLGIVPNISRWGFHLPSKIGKRALTIKNPKYASIVGALTFFLPCWFTQSMQLFAIQNGDPFQWGILMAIFALGTMPVLLGIGVGTEYIKKKITFLRPILASLLIAFWIFTIYNGFTLAKIQSNTTFNSQKLNTTLPQEIIEVEHNGYEFIPYTINLEQGKQYIIRVTPSNNGRGCMYALAYWGKIYDIKKNISFDLPVDASKPQKIPLVCASMGMRQGLINIE